MHTYIQPSVRRNEFAQIYLDYFNKGEYVIVGDNVFRKFCGTFRSAAVD